MEALIAQDMGEGAGALMSSLEIVEDREDWRAAVHGVAKSHT